jgi:hypothetical protein
VTGRSSLVSQNLFYMPGLDSISVSVVQVVHFWGYVAVLYISSYEFHATSCSMG